ncbi:MAG: hypothetical protein Q9220_001100 [cf. Caloplaca sp. 1 TL-2023]
MSSFKISVLCLSIVISRLDFACAQQNSTQQNSTSSCFNSETFGPNGDTYNASASYQIPGFYPPGNGTTPPANWTYNIATVSGSKGNYSQAIWIDTPDNTDVSSKNLPYIGCVAAFFSLPSGTDRRGQDDNGDCTKALDQDCVQGVIKFAKQRAIGVARTSYDASGICAGLLSMAVPDACKKYTGGGSTWGDGAASASIGNSTFSNGTDSRGCDHNDEKGANKGSLAWSLSGSTDDNQTSYDRALTSITPVLTAVWEKGNNTENPFALGYTDARFVCMRPSQIKEGSSAPKGVPSLGVSVMVDGMSKGASLAAVMLMAFIVWS